MKPRALCWIVVPLLIAAVVYALRTDEGRRIRATVTRSGPVVEFPAILDLGDRERGEVAVGRFTVANRGGGELLIDRIRTNCACSGLEREAEGEFIRVDSVRLGPDERAERVLRVSVRGRAGEAVRNQVYFRTNDPTRPEAVIETVIRNVTAGVTALPTSVIFGTVPRGESRARRWKSVTGLFGRGALSGSRVPTRSGSLCACCPHRAARPIRQELRPGPSSGRSK